MLFVCRVQITRTQRFKYSANSSNETNTPIYNIFFHFDDKTQIGSNICLGVDPRNFSIVDVHMNVIWSKLDKLKQTFLRSIKHIAMLICTFTVDSYRQNYQKLFVMSHFSKYELFIWILVRNCIMFFYRKE